MTETEGAPPEAAGPGAPDELTARAKLTLSLQVAGVRADGYHALESEMVALDFADTIIVSEGTGLTVTERFGEPGPSWRGGSGDRRAPFGGRREAWRSATVPIGADNLALRALDVVGRRAAVRLVKRIPPGAGLGGGSADAAAVLRWAGCTDPTVAASIGADVPFCVLGGRAVVSGIGDVVTPLPFEERHFTLLLPPFGIDTAAVYRAWDDLTERGQRLDPSRGSNDLEVAAIAVEPRLALWRRVFADAAGASPRLAGSGSTWFVEGAPDEHGLGGRPWLTMGYDRALLVPAATTRPTGAGLTVG